MKRISAREVIARVDALMPQVQSLYRGSIINKRGKTRKSEIPYGELIAQRLLHTHNFPEVVKTLPKIPKGVDIRPTDHDGTMLDPTILGIQQESRVAVALYNHRNLGMLGKVIDYLIPVTIEERGIGTIDLITFDAETRTLFVIGYSYHEQKMDTVLRSVLEIATLRNSLHDWRFIKAYEELLVDGSEDPVDPLEVHIESALLFLEGSYQDRSVRALKRTPHIASLVNELGIKVCTIGVELELRDKPRFTRKQAIHPYKPVFHFVPILKERQIPTF